ncbi:MAG: DUF58 domain-containing protein [Deltaproteobacteria bacterium]|nr:DUF58 domain-containing protein [Deltaproteobacteria bacterium]
MSAFTRILSRYLNPRRRLRFTREGWIFSALTLGIGLVAVNTGHNLFYLVFGLLLSVVIVSGLLSERVVRGIEVHRHMPSEVTARVPFAVVLELHNPRQRKISYALAVSDGGDFFPRRTLGYLSVLGPGERRSFPYLAQVETRGLHRFGPVHLATRFPFGLFEKVRVIPLEESFIAYPGLKESSRLRALASGRDRIGSKKWRWGEEVLGLRPALHEDDHRFIHWRTSARMGQLMVKEFVEEIEYPRPVFFDDRGDEGERFEQAVETAASLLRLMVENGVAVTFATWQDHFQPMASAEEMKSALRHLALIGPSQKMMGQGFDHWRSQTIREGGGIFIQGEALPPPALPPCEVVRA